MFGIPVRLVIAFNCSLMRHAEDWNTRCTVHYGGNKCFCLTDIRPPLLCNNTPVWLCFTTKSTTWSHLLSPSKSLTWDCLCVPFKVATKKKCLSLVLVQMRASCHYCTRAHVCSCVGLESPARPHWPLSARRCISELMLAFCSQDSLQVHLNMHVFPVVYFFLSY